MRKIKVTVCRMLFGAGFWLSKLAYSMSVWSFDYIKVHATDTELMAVVNPYLKPYGIALGQNVVIAEAPRMPN